MYHAYSEEGSQNYEKAQIASENGYRVKAFKHYLKAAEAGIVPAMVACGNMYLEGDGVKKDLNKSFEWFQKAAKFNNIVAINNIGYIYEIQENYKEALKWYKRAAESNDVVAMLNLAGFYMMGLGTRKNEKLGQQWIDKAESFTDLKSLKEIANYYSEIEVPEKAAEFYEKAAELDDAESMNSLGDIYINEDNLNAAEHWYYRAAKLGNVDAMTNLGIIFIFDYEDFEKAHYWLEKAIAGGNTYALQMMGDLYKKFEQYPKALRWYRKAAQAGEWGAFEDIHKVKKMLQTFKPNYKLRLRSLA